MRGFICTSLFALALALSTAPAAQAEERHGHRHHHHGGGVAYPSIEDSRKVSLRLNQRVRDEVIPLRRLLDLDRSFRGYEVEKVVVRLKPRRKTERLVLIADGEVIDSRRARHDRRVVLTPHAREVLGVTLRRLQLAVDGAAFIRSIEVQLAAPRRLSRPGAARGWKHRLTREELSHRLGAEIARVLAGRTRLGL